LPSVDEEREYLLHRLARVKLGINRLVEGIFAHKEVRSIPESVKR
jgi:hypothetical protein